MGRECLPSEEPLGPAYPSLRLSHPLLPLLLPLPSDASPNTLRLLLEAHPRPVARSHCSPPVPGQVVWCAAKGGRSGRHLFSGI